MKFTLNDIFCGLFTKPSKSKIFDTDSEDEGKSKEYIIEQQSKAQATVQEALKVLKKHLIEKEDHKDFLLNALSKILTVHTENPNYHDIVDDIFLKALGTKDSGLKYKGRGDYSVFKAVHNLSESLSEFTSKSIPGGEQLALNEPIFVEEAYKTLLGEYNELVSTTDSDIS